MNRFALKNPIAVAMAALAVVLLGALALTRLPVDLFPNIDIPVILIGTLYPGAAPEEIERTVSFRIEKAVSQTPGIDYVSSQSRYGMSIVRAWYKWGTDIDAAELNVAQEVQSIQKNLPHGIFPPFVVAFDVSNIPCANVLLESKELDEKALYDLAVNTISPELSSVPGVSYASPTGGKVREVDVLLDPDRMREKGVDVLDVEKAISNENLLMSSGDMEIGKLDYNIYTNDQFQVIRHMNDVVVKTVHGIPIYVRDVGEVVDGAAIQVNIARVNGKRSVYLSVYRQPGTNMIAVVDALKAALPRLPDIPASVHMTVSFDQSKFIRAAIASLKREGLQGAILAALVILLFLGSVRSTLIVLLALPLSVLATFIGFMLGNQTLNQFTLGGLTLVTGMLIDNAIVVLENVHRHLEQGETPLHAAFNGAREVSTAVLTSTIVIVVVFMPVVFLKGVAKFLFTPMMITIALAMGASYVVSQTAVPVLCRRFLRKSHDEHESPGGWRRLLGAGVRLLDWLDGAYVEAVRRVLAHRWAVMGAVAAIFALSLLLVPHIGTEFFPEADESQFRVLVRAPIGTRVSETEKIVEKMEGITRKVIGDRYIRNIVSNIGLPRGSRSSFYATNTGPHSAYLQVELVPPPQRPLSSEGYISKLRPALIRELPGDLVTFDPGGVVKKVLNFGYEAPIDVEERGHSLRAARRLAQETVAVMKTIPGLKDILISREEHYPEYDVNVDREKASLAGISERQVAHTILSSIYGNYSQAPYYIDPKTGNQYFVVTRLFRRYLQHRQDLGDLTMMSQGRPLYLKSIAHLVRNSSPVEIDRRYMERVVDITANPEGRDLGGISAELARKLHRLRLPPGFELHLRGQTQEQRQAFASLKGASLLALLLVFMILAAQFRSLVQPLVMLATVPLGLSGVFAALFLTHTALSTTSFMGVIMMVGIVVSNGVLLIDFANQARARGETVEDAIVHAGRSRLRPILMTASATLAGLFPIALGIGEGAEENAPLARAVIGGLMLSTLLTLFFLPALYATVEKRFGRPADEAERRELASL